VTQASLRLQQFVHHLWHQITALLHTRRFKYYSRKIEAARGWLLSLAVLLLLWLWNWPLVVSGGLGLAVWVLVYLAQQGQWQLPRINWQALWKPSNRALTLAFLSGTIVCVSTYLTLAIWRESGGSWVGKGLILEGFGILAIVLLLLWQRIESALNPSANFERSASQSDLLLSQWLNDLSAPDALRRLIAIQRLTQWVLQHNADSSLDRTRGTLPLPPTALADCFRLMLDRETEPTLCRTLLSSLQALNSQQSHSLQPGQTSVVRTSQPESLKEER
jgi:hypothetical protein